MNSRTFLITGATGFLGKRLAQTLLASGNKVVGTGHSESGIKKFQRSVSTKIPIYAVDIVNDHTVLKNIVKKHSVDYIIHAAALKHVGICEKNPTRAIDVNIIGSRNVIKAAIECGVKNAISISTDKAVRPLCVYGMTKKLMENMFLEAGFGVFQGVNFLFSSESVLDIWGELKSRKEPILVNLKASRYFSSIDQVCDTIISSLDKKERFSVDECYHITISDLQKAFSTYHNYWNAEEYLPLDIEKIEEDLPVSNIKINNPSIVEIVQLFSEYYNNGANK